MVDVPSDFGDTIVEPDSSESDSDSDADSDSDNDATVPPPPPPPPTNNAAGRVSSATHKLMLKNYISANYVSTRTWDTAFPLFDYGGGRFLVQESSTRLSPSVAPPDKFYKMLVLNFASGRPVIETSPVTYTQWLAGQH